MVFHQRRRGGEERREGRERGEEERRERRADKDI